MSCIQIPLLSKLDYIMIADVYSNELISIVLKHKCLVFTIKVTGTEYNLWNFLLFPKDTLEIICLV